MIDWQRLARILTLLGTGLLGLALLLIRPPAPIIAAILFLAGLAQLLLPVAPRRARRLYRLTGLTDAATGLLLLLMPAAAALLSLLAAGLLLLGGIVRVSLADLLNPAGHDRAMAAGVISLLLGMMLLGGWGLSGPWFIAGCLGLHLLLNGLAARGVGMEAARS